MIQSLASWALITALLATCACIALVPELVGMAIN